LKTELESTEYPSYPHLSLHLYIESRNMKASVLYLVRFRISPSEGGPFLNWLEGGHIAEVIQEPGFIWARH